ncbi:hypothetical protein NADE_005118 [Nannochloris sp. 'desiccata']|nr:hypothetical protein NADE_005118 [Chlorella desiccata (nom. nud.)]
MRVNEIPGRGLGVVAERPLQAGETIITDMPIILYPQSSAVSEGYLALWHARLAPQPAFAANSVPPLPSPTQPATATLSAAVYPHATRQDSLMTNRAP